MTEDVMQSCANCEHLPSPGYLSPECRGCIQPKSGARIFFVPRTVDDVDTPEATAPAGGLKFDGDKPALALLPIESLEEVGKVLTFGAKKYAAHNWRQGFKWSRLLSAAMRHLFAFTRGEDKDPETGLSHLAHAACCLLFLISFGKTGAGEDDRFKVQEIAQ